MTTAAGTESREGSGDQAESLLYRARGGDADAFCQLAETHEGRLYRQAVALCRCEDLAEDLTAETLMEAWKSLARFRGGCRLSTWLYGILLHRHQKAVRRRQARLPMLSALPSAQARSGEAMLARVPSEEATAGDVLLRREFSQQLSAAVAGLPPGQEAVVRLRFFEGARLPEIGAALGIPLGTVKSRLHTAMENLRQRQDLLNLWRGEGDTGL